MSQVYSGALRLSGSEVLRKLDADQYPPMMSDTGMGQLQMIEGFVVRRVGKIYEELLL